MSADNPGYNGSVWTVEETEPKRQNPPSNCEEALAATGYGLFNVLLLLAALPIAWTCIIDTTSTAFIINSAECTFELTMFRRGIAVSAIYIGMIIAGPLWDFYLQDCVIGYLGRKNVMMIGIFLDAICNLLWVHTTSFYAFIALKFVSGVLIAGPLSVVMAYLAEFHAPAYQAKFARWAGLLVMASNIVPAALAATLLLRTPWFHFTIYSRFYPTWQVYLLICAIPSVLGLFTVCLMPKSPKFLMAQGKSDKALRLFRTMYRLNNFKSASQYPITELTLPEKANKGKTNSACRDKLRDSIVKLKELFSKPHLKNISILVWLQFACMIGFNVSRLWVPPLFVMMNNFRVHVRQFYPADEYITMCEMIFPRLKIDYASCNYTLPSLESAVYVNSTSIASSAVGFGFLFLLLSDTRIKKIVVMVFTFLLSAAGAFGANWAVEIPYMLVLVAFVIVASRITGNTVMAYNAQVLPPLLRPTAVNVLNFVGNLGAAAGNLAFSLIIGIDCLSALLALGCISMVSTLVPIFLISQSKKKVKPGIERY
ncbi:hypothetical protein TSAR_005893 [Trichomalopsis sarcophagae]|uniref:Major facilitator superfamily (MFS) profile domain-containing protein n=1 Tax=Trichomalopsis sarcophagae TaxID=543379 RepID=A0A232F047_9HYME|nr:hypothetical protein TSAR_005893 [Trichomalopsis sarcophagae]